MLKNTYLYLNHSWWKNLELHFVEIKKRVTFIPPHIHFILINNVGACETHRAELAGIATVDDFHVVEFTLPRDVMELGYVHDDVVLLFKGEVGIFFSSKNWLIDIQ